MKWDRDKWMKVARAVLGISIIGMLIINNAVFLHAHKLPNGYVVIHAHPFSKNKDTSPFKVHHHSHAEFFLLHHLQLFFFIGIFLFCGIFFRQFKVFSISDPPAYINVSIHHFSTRGPPVLH